MDISAKIVMELRQVTGAGMMDCKKALAAVEGDMEKAIDFLREKGLAAAAKKASRIAAEGLVASAIEGNVGALVEVNCETDFVAKNDEFKSLAEDIARTIVKNNPADVEALLAAKFAGDEGKTVSEIVTEKIAKIGEKIDVRRFVRYDAGESGLVDSYIHMGGKVGVLIEAKGVSSSDDVSEVLHDCALQVAAASPVAAEYVRRDEVRAEHLDHEKEILAAQARNEGKPENIIQKMVEGRVAKFYKDVCLLEQLFVKNGDLNVMQMIDQKAKGMEIVRFTRYKMGDGLEKKVTDLAAEVAEQTAAMKKQ